jgi:hypothetical protein
VTIDTRDNAITEKAGELSEVGLKLVTTGTTTLDAEAAAGQNTVPITATANFDVDDYAAFGVGNEMEIIDIETVNVDVSVVAKSELYRTHASGLTIRELVDVVLGDVTEDGFQDELSLAMNVHNVGTKHGPWDATPGHHETNVSFGIVNCTLDNLQHQLGLAAADGSGTGTDADPWVLDTNPEDFNKGLLQSALCLDGRIPCVYVKGEYLNSGETFEVQYWSCTLGGGDFGFPVKVDDITPVMFRFMWFANRRFLRYGA